MKELGIEDRFIIIDKHSGKDFDRDQYQVMKRIIREGDLVYIDTLDRLGRDYDGIIWEWKEITRNMGTDILVLENETLFDSWKLKQMGDMGKLMEDQFLSLLSYVAEQERKKIRQRQAEGIAVAKAEGRHLGRPLINLESLSKEERSAFEAMFPRWECKEITAVEYMDKLGIKKNTFYKIVKKYQEVLA
jgi:DNA invertase Pin-like site-specific DNA recombinase